MRKPYTLILTLAALTASAENSLDKPLAMPFYENFAGGKYDHEGWEVIPVSGETATLSLTDHDPVTGLVSYVDRDKGLLVINNDKAGSFYLMSPLRLELLRLSVNYVRLRSCLIALRRRAS